MTRYGSGSQAMRTAMVCATIMVAVLLLQPVSVTAAIDNVAFQWTNLLNTLFCSTGAILTSSIQPQLHLAQWHALLALQNTGDCTRQEAVVAYASHKILSHYFSYAQDSAISPLLDRQIRGWNLSGRQKKLAKRLGEAVALSLIIKRSPAGEFALGEMKDALNANLNPATGVFRYFNDTAAGRDAAFFVFNNVGLYKPFVVPHPLKFVEEFLSDLKPPVIPSTEWDENWSGLKDVGRIDWPGRTAEMNLIANLVGCTQRVKNNVCSREQFATAAVQSSLPASTTLHDSVKLLAKVSVSMYDAALVHITIKYGYWFWRPIHAFPAGDSTHAPIPSWKPYRQTPPEPEYPSGTVAIAAAGARPLQAFFGAGKAVAFTIPGGGTFNCPGIEGQPIPSRSFASIDAFVNETQWARLFAGAHFPKAVKDGLTVANTVADYVLKHWTDTTPSGVLPDPIYLDIFAKLPKKTGEYLPLKFDI